MKKVMVRFGVAIGINALIVSFIMGSIVALFGVNVPGASDNYFLWYFTQMLIFGFGAYTVLMFMVYLGFVKKINFFYYLTYLVSLLVLFGFYLPSIVYLWYLLYCHEFDVFRT